MPVSFSATGIFFQEMEVSWDALSSFVNVTVVAVVTVVCSMIAFVFVVVGVVSVGDEEETNRLGESEGESKGDGVETDSERQIGIVFPLVTLCVV